MKKLVVVILLFTTAVTDLRSFAEAEQAMSVKPGEKNNDLQQTAIISMLYREIDLAINDYYDNARGYDLFDASVISVANPYNMGWDTHDITVQVYTFEGAHNPPLGTEIMTFRISLDKAPILLNFEHKDSYIY